MAKDPAFLFYPGDYLRDTQCLSEQSQVAYDRIMCEHMRNICITQQQLKFFTKRLSNDEREELDMILTKVDKGYQIDWVVDSILKRRAYSESRRKNRQSSSKKISKSYVPHMENENEEEDSEVVIIKKDKIPKIVEFLVYADQLCQKTSRNFHSLKFSIEAKYQTWVDDGWKTGHGKPIKNWKNTLSNTFPHLIPIHNNEKNATDNHKRVIDELGGSKLS